jgi:serine/threonine-protein kinase
VGETQPENSAIVLPFANVSGDPELEYLADGFSESLTNTLSRIPVLRVIARTTAFRYKGQEVDVQKIGRDLNVGVLVTGKLSRVGEQVRLQADLIDARDGIQIWGQEYTTTRGDTLSVQADVVRNLTARLATRLTDEEKREISRHSTRRSDAYDSYLKGRYALMRFTVSDIQKSIGHFQNALQADPSYALAYTGLADSYWMLSSMFLKPSDAMTKARAAAEKALSVDPMLAEAHMSRGVIRGWYEFDWKRSESELRKAIELNPNDATARLWYAWNLVLNGQIRKGIEEARIAHDLDPLSPYVETGLAQMIAYSGDHQAAIRRLQGVNGLDPDFFGGHHYLGTLYVAAKQYRAAAASFEQARRLDPEQPQPIAYLAYARAMIGDVESARSLVAELTNLARKRYVSGFLFAVASLALGSDQEAVAWLEKASEERDDMVSLLAIDRLFDGLRPNPRFQAVMRKVGFGELNTDTRSRSSTR